ncbi:MAG: Flp family type IVb pilin [Comamonas sp.]|uniref:Flp family type IVb pilin n=1 Tax=Comamonas sp. BIGb0152 TaxID=2940601 RepID=UPI002169734B|nr:Flp family type IVb pilin [Comamonas sp. BIGb0152]MCS4295471.1 pilus assembly protein Flp/PilA [Comamonas sp. BIGb0152]
MTNIIKNFWNDEEGATAIEYGLIAGLISVAIIAVLTTMGGSLNTLFGYISDALSGVSAP